MKLAIVLLIFPCLNVLSQDLVVDYSSLKFKNDVAFYKGNEFTGKAFKPSNIDKKNIIYNFDEGLLNGRIKINNEIFIYKKGIIQEYFYKHKDGSDIIHINNLNLDKLIVKIKIGIWFNNQKNDTVFFSKKDLESDLIEFKFGVIIYCKNGSMQFIELSNLKLLICDISAHCGGLDIYDRIKGNTMSSLYFRQYRLHLIYIGEFSVKLPNNEIYNISSFDIQRIYFKYE